MKPWIGLVVTAQEKRINQILQTKPTGMLDFLTVTMFLILSKPRVEVWRRGLEEFQVKIAAKEKKKKKAVSKKSRASDRVWIQRSLRPDVNPLVQTVSGNFAAK